MVTGPVVVGGVGGSGTRVVAQMMLGMGFDMGNDLNEPLDDLWFNLLFYRPTWLSNEPRLAADPIPVGLDLMRKRAFGQRRLSGPEVGFISRAWTDIAHDRHFGRSPSAWAARRIWRFSRPSASVNAGYHIGWGWKEPISHLVAPEILEHFGDARYVHVIRHGLDMAFSTNLNQVKFFGTLFGIAVPAGQRPSPVDALRYWIRASQRTVGGVCTRVPERTHIVVFDDLCRTPEREVTRLVDFLGVGLGTSRRRELSRLPAIAGSGGRYKSHDLAVFEHRDLEAVAGLGFPL